MPCRKSRQSEKKVLLLAFCDECWGAKKEAVVFFFLRSLTESCEKEKRYMSAMGLKSINLPASMPHPGGSVCVSFMGKESEGRGGEEKAE